MKALTLAELTKRIDSLNTSASKLGEEYQEVGLLCLQHLASHGDVGPVNRLVLGMPKSTRRLAMATWMVNNGALVPNQDQATRDTMPLKYSKDKETNMELAASVKWYEAAPERKISDVFDLQVAIKSLINRAKGKTLLIGGESKGHEAKAVLSMLAAGVSLPNPFAEEDAAAAAAIADKAIGGAKAGTAPGSTQVVPQVLPAGAQAAVAATTDKPSVHRAEKAAAKGASRKTTGKRTKTHA